MVMKKDLIVMLMTDTNWLPLLTLVGICLGMLGSLYLAYDLFGRSKVLCRLSWTLSSGFLFASVLLISWLVLVGPERFTTGSLPAEVWRLTILLSWGVFIVLFIDYSPPSIRPSPPYVNWLKLVYWVALIGFALVMLGATFAPQGFNIIAGVIFALPGIFVVGALNGFSSTIQWWVLQLPEWRVAGVGAVLIFCGFGLALVQPLCRLMGIAL
jgi:hypothetical protein